MEKRRKVFMRPALQKKLKNKKGFTLAELLIVIAIISILVAIAIPTFSAALSRAQEAVEVANARSTYAEGMVEYLNGTYGAGVIKHYGDKKYEFTYLSGNIWEVKVTPEGSTKVYNDVYSNDSDRGIDFSDVKVDGNEG